MDPVTLGIAVGGVLLLIATLRLTGTRKDAVLDAVSVTAALRTDLPEFAPTDIVVSRDERVALARDAANHLVAVYSFGDSINVRPLPGSDIAAVEPTTTGLRLRVRDFTHPQLELQTDADTAARWIALARPEAV